MKKASRAQVVTQVATLDVRGKFKRDTVICDEIGELPAPAARVSQRLPVASSTPIEIPDFAELETAAGIW